MPPPDGAHDLSAVIPVHDAEENLAALVTSFLACDLAVQVVLVDDCSTDASPGIMAELAAGHDDIVCLAHDTNRGAGVARNTGFPAATGRYTIFFDADDILHPDSLMAVIPVLDETGADMAFMPYRYLRGGSPGNEAMNHFDLDVWDDYIGGVPQRLTSLDRSPRLLGFSNYPWNKILRTEHHRRAGLRFGSTPVHNDILGHWHCLLHSRSILLFNQELCTHIVGTTGANLSNRDAGDRLSLFDALDETYDLLSRDSGQRQRYAHHYWSLVLRVSRWAEDRIGPAHANEFRQRRRAHLLRADVGDFASIRMKRDPGLASDMVTLATA